MLDYGIGNLHSAQKAIEQMGADARLTADPALIADADGVVLPGVGAFGACMDALRGAGLERPALDAVASGRPFLGICVGMQMLFDGSEEDPAATGLGVIPGTIRWIPPGSSARRCSGTSCTLALADDPMFAGLGDGAWVYFVHSLHGVPDDPDVVAATCEYGDRRSTPRSGSATCSPPSSTRRSRAAPGLRLLGNFVDVVRASRDVDRPVSGDRPARRPGRATDARATTTAETVYGDDPVAVARVVRRRRCAVGPRRRPRRGAIG